MAESASVAGWHELLVAAYGEEFGKTGHQLAGHEVRWDGRTIVEDL